MNPISSQRRAEALREEDGIYRQVSDITRQELALYLRKSTLLQRAHELGRGRKQRADAGKKRAKRTHEAGDAAACDVTEK